MANGSAGAAARRMTPPPTPAEGRPTTGPEAAGPPVDPASRDVTIEEHDATQLWEMIPSSFIYASLGRVFRDLKPSSCKVYRDRLLRDCASPTDPIEVMLLEQLSMAHLNVGFISAKAAASESVEAASAYWAAAAKLMGEFRRSSLALQTYRGGQARDSRDDDEGAERDRSPKELADTGLEGRHDAAGDPVIPFAGIADGKR